MTERESIYDTGMKAWERAGEISSILNAERDSRDKNKEKAIEVIKERGFTYLSENDYVDPALSVDDVPYENIKDTLGEAIGEQNEIVDEFVEKIEGVVKRKNIRPSLEVLAGSKLVLQRVGDEDREHIENYAEVAGTKAVLTKFKDSDKKGYAGLAEKERELIAQYAIIGLQEKIGKGKSEKAAQREARLTALAVKSGYYPRSELISYASEGVNAASTELEKIYGGRTVSDIAGEVVVDIVKNGSFDEYQEVMGTLHALYKPHNENSEE